MDTLAMTAIKQNPAENAKREWSRGK